MPNQSKTFFRFCANCGEKFYPSGKGSRLCDKCFVEAHKNGAGHRKKNYFFRYCEVCNKKFKPHSKGHKVCVKCKIKKIRAYKTHNCPFIEMGKFCTHKEAQLSPDCSRPLCECMYKINCKLLKNSPLTTKLNLFVN